MQLVIDREAWGAAVYGDTTEQLNQTEDLWALPIPELCKEESTFRRKATRETRTRADRDGRKWMRCWVCRGGCGEVLQAEGQELFPSSLSQTSFQNTHSQGGQPPKQGQKEPSQENLNSSREKTCRLTISASPGGKASSPPSHPAKEVTKQQTCPTTHQHTGLPASFQGLAFRNRSLAPQCLTFKGSITHTERKAEK